MEILIGIVLYFGFAVFVGRFLSLSTAGDMIFPVTEADPAPRLAERRDRAPADRSREKKEELVLR